MTRTDLPPGTRQRRVGDLLEVRSEAEFRLTDDWTGRCWTCPVTASSWKERRAWVPTIGCARAGQTRTGVRSGSSARRRRGRSFKEWKDE